MSTIHDTVKDWKVSQLPDLTGKKYLITGGNSGLGLEAAKILGNRNAHVMITSRSKDKGESAVAEIVRHIGNDKDSRIALVELDLANMASIKGAVENIKQQVSKLDGVINNAGIMQTPQQTTKDGFEMQLGTNHLGHFLLNGLLYPLVVEASGRFVPVSSIAHKSGKINFDDIMSTKKYSPMAAYCQSKLANLMYGFELQRRLDSVGSKVSSISCHPGYAATNLQSTGPKGFFKIIYKVTNKLMAQSASAGAAPEVLAAAGEEAQPGAYYGPTKMGGAKGPVGDADVASQALDEEAASKLWDLSQELVDFEWKF